MILLIVGKKIRNINKCLNSLIRKLKKFSNFCGVLYLEDLDWKEQIKVFLENKTIITPHGSALINTIWSSNNNIIEILFQKKTKKYVSNNMYLDTNNIYRFH